MRIVLSKVEIIVDMRRYLVSVTTCVFFFMAFFINTLLAAAQQPSSGGHRASKYYEDNASSASARASRQRQGGYSYSARDTINTYGDSRTLNGGANSYRFEFYTRQTPSGPFDHGFFFDSGIGMNGGNSPYNN